MCRSIERLRTTEGAAERERIEAAARQFVRKISGFRSPPSAAPEAFEETIRTITDASERLLGALPPLRSKPPSAGDAADGDALGS